MNPLNRKQRVQCLLSPEQRRVLTETAQQRGVSQSVVIGSAIDAMTDKVRDADAYNAALDRRLNQFGDTLMTRLDLYLGEVFAQMTQQVRGDLASTTAAITGASVQTAVNGIRPPSPRPPTWRPPQPPK